MTNLPLTYRPYIAMIFPSGKAMVQGLSHPLEDVLCERGYPEVQVFSTQSWSDIFGGFFNVADKPETSKLI